MEDYSGGIIFWLIVIFFCFAAKHIKQGIKEEEERLRQIHDPAQRRARHESVAQYDYHSSIKKNTALYPKKRWIKKDGEFSIQDRSIKGGFVYFGVEQNDDYDYYYYQNDACLIDPRFDVNFARPSNNNESLGYWPSYSEISAESRAAYLLWLDSDRKDPNIDIGFVFLYFYGLERRIVDDFGEGLVSSEEMDQLKEEINRLQFYYRKHISFKGYAELLLNFARYRDAPEKAITDHLETTRFYYSIQLKIQLAKASINQEPINPDQAFVWLMGDRDYSFRMPSKRCSTEFEVLFKEYYKNKYGEGIIVKPNKTTLKIQYRPASYSVSSIDQEVKLNGQLLPDLTVLTAPLKKLRLIADKAQDELDQLSRAKGPKKNPFSEFELLSFLPKTLLAISEDSNLKKLLEYLNSLNSDLNLVDSEELIKFWEYDDLKNLSKKQSELICLLLENLNYSIAPNILHHNTKIPRNGKLVVYHGSSSGIDSDSKSFRLLLLMVHLAVLVAQADGNVDDLEKQTITNMIESQNDISDPEKKSLIAYMEWRITEKPSRAGLNSHIKLLNEDQRSSIGKVLINVTFADGKIDPDEIKVTESIFKSIGLDELLVVSMLHNIHAAGPIKVRAKDKVEEYAIPKEQHDQETVKQSLNKELIKLKASQTNEIREVLSNIFSDSEDNEPDQSQEMDEEQLLTGKQKGLYEFLLQKDEWNYEDIDQYCRQNDIMFEGAVESINDYTVNLTGVPLVELADKVYVDQEIIEELK